MEEDIKLKELLQQLAMQDTSADFTQQIMHRIEAAANAKQQTTSLLEGKLMKALASVFVLVFLLLLLICSIGRPIEFSMPLNLEIPSDSISQLISFVIVFWIVVLVNYWYQKRSNGSQLTI